MLLSDRKLRIYGATAFAAIYYGFFILQELARPHGNTWVLLGKGLGATALYIATLWEPVRLVILWCHQHWGATHQVFKRKLMLALILLPYSVVLAVGGQILENMLIWQLPVKRLNPAFYISMVGLNILFILLEVALYESLFFIGKWHKSSVEARELKKMNLQLQYDSLKVQIQPHFLFNTLNTLIGLIEMDQRRAVRFTEELAYVYRYLLAASERPMIELEEEFKFTKAYFFLLKNRYPQGLHLSFDESDDYEDYCIPPLSLQLLVENAVKHNVITDAKPLHVNIHYNAEKGSLEITNNLQRKQASSGHGRGLVHLIKKFELLNINGVKITEQNGLFKVVLPLVKSKEYESIDY